jgi:hypothetical protein
MFNAKRPKIDKPGFCDQQGIPDREAVVAIPILVQVAEFGQFAAGVSASRANIIPERLAGFLPTFADVDSSHNRCIRLHCVTSFLCQWYVTT